MVVVVSPGFNFVFSVLATTLAANSIPKITYYISTKMLNVNSGNQPANRGRDTAVHSRPSPPSLSPTLSSPTCPPQIAQYQSANNATILRHHWTTVYSPVYKESASLITSWSPPYCSGHKAIHPSTDLLNILSRLSTSNENSRRFWGRRLGNWLR